MFVCSGHKGILERNHVECCVSKHWLYLYIEFSLLYSIMSLDNVYSLIYAHRHNQHNVITKKRSRKGIGYLCSWWFGKEQSIYSRGALVSSLWHCLALDCTESKQDHCRQWTVCITHIPKVRGSAVFFFNIPFRKSTLSKNSKYFLKVTIFR